MPLSKRAPKLVASDSTYLDPLNCDSTISYKIINGPRRTWGNVQLADCTRKIEWYFRTNEPLEKIDRAIAILEKFRKDLAVARAERKEPVVRRRKIATAA